MPADIIKAKARLEKQLRMIEDQIQELKSRLPAHSVKPVMMMELLALEDEHENILVQIQALATQAPEK